MDELDCRELFLDFYSSELTTHARLIIGFAVILLTLVEITLNLTARGSISSAQFLIAYSGIFAASFALWFLLMRHLTYGVLANAATHATQSDDSGKNPFDRMRDGISESACKHAILGFIPVCLFLTTGARITRLQKLFRVSGARALGIVLCGTLALTTTHFLMVLVGLV